MKRRQVTLIVRMDVPIEATFNVARQRLRHAIHRNIGPEEHLVSLAPIPADRIIKRRKPPTRPEFPLLDFIKAAR